MVPLFFWAALAGIGFMLSQSSDDAPTEPEEPIPPDQDDPDMTTPPNLTRALAVLQSWDGRSAYDKDQARALDWAKTLLRNDKPSAALYYLKQKKSTCALVSKAYLYEGGCRCREHLSYLVRDGMAVSDITTIAQRHGAWINSATGKGTYPQAGDVITVGPEPSWHVLTVLGTDAATGHVISEDGGQSSYGAYTFARARKMFVTRTGGDLVDTADGRSSRVGYVRPIYGRLDGAKVFSTLHLCK